MAVSDLIGTGPDLAPNRQTYKASVRAATTANITLQDEQTIDGVAVVDGDRVLVKDQSTGAENGVYVCVDGANDWVRAVDFNESTDAHPGAVVTVQEGTANGDTLWLHTTNAPITLDTTALTFSEISSGGAGSDTTAIHDDTAAEISAVTEKTQPLFADKLLIESAADSNAKRMAQVGWTVHPGWVVRQLQLAVNRMGITMAELGFVYGDQLRNVNKGGWTSNSSGGSAVNLALVGGGVSYATTATASRRGAEEMDGQKLWSSGAADRGYVYHRFYVPVLTTAAQCAAFIGTRDASYTFGQYTFGIGHVGTGHHASGSDTNLILFTNDGVTAQVVNSGVATPTGAAVDMAGWFDGTSLYVRVDGTEVSAAETVLSPDGSPCIFAKNTAAGGNCTMYSLRYLFAWRDNV